ncbi:TonB-dependent receptor [Oceanicaulis alexandrii]|uniref:TonB-dependent receptor n=1 Tax=Oceanicaulis alexandrii TaxID=153233 RepID=UPI002356D11D|nr:TonB-dependent receptor [Oceanicaulis alexandrii]
MAHRSNALMGASALVLSLLAGEVALAQVESSDIITITAQRRAQSIQDVPIAVSAFDEEALRGSAIEGIGGIADRTPGFTMSEFNIGEPQLYIRGVGSTSDSAAGDPSVAVFIDEVYIGRAGGGAISFFDLERVEVLRGPQGTLYGRNAAGGAVNIITAKPDGDDPFTEVTVGYGEYEDIQLTGVANGAIGEGVAGRIALLYHDHAGYAENAVTGQDLQGARTIGGRGAISFENGPVSGLFQIDVSRDETDGQARIPVAGPNTAPPLVALIGALRSGLDERESFSSPNTFQERNTYGAQARFDVERDAFTFTSLSSWRATDFSWFDDLGGLPTPPYVLLVEDRADEDSDQFTQEFRFTSNNDSGVSWVAGLFLFHEDVNRSENFVVDALPPFPSFVGGDVTFTQNATNQSVAGFAQMTWPVTETVNLTGGVRLTWDSKEILARGIDNDTPGGPFPGIPLGPPPLGVAFPGGVTGEESWTEPTWRLAADWRPNDNILAYASYDRGYKSGLYPSQAQNAVQASTPLDPEILDNFEIGLKTNWNNGRFILNGSAFFTDYQDLQVYELLGLALVTSNADAEIFGVEIETQARLTDNFMVGGTYAYLDAEYVSDAQSAIGVLPYNGNQLTRAPENKYTVFAQLDAPIGPGYARLRTDYQHTGEYFFDPSNNPEVLVDSYSTVDARLSWQPNDERWEVALWAKNLGDETYPLHIIKNNGIGFNVFAPPRTWGASLRVRFGG